VVIETHGRLSCIVHASRTSAPSEFSSEMRDSGTSHPSRVDFSPAPSM
jgi:hypothetical protein